MNRDTVLHVLSYGTIALAMGFMFWFAYMLLWPVKTIEATPNPMRVISTEVYPGENFIYESSTCVFRDLTTKFTPQLRDGIVVSFPTRTADLREGCRTVISNSLIVPVNTPPGIYKFAFINEIQVNPLRTINVVIETEEFQVLELKE